MSVIAFDGTEVLLTEERWKHVVFRHLELENKSAVVLNVVAYPEEVYIDGLGAFHVLRKLVNEVSDYLVVIYVRENKEGYNKNGFLHRL
jgi:hypothetical protein